MHPHFNIFGHQILAYGFIGVISYTAALCYGYFSCVQLGIKRSHAIIFLFFGFFVQYYGGMIIPFFYRLIYLHEINIENPGRYFHSVFFSFLAYLLVTSKVMKWPVKKLLDRFIVAAMMMSAIGRVGCFLQGCCEGTPSNLPWALKFPSQPGIAVHPAQIYMLIIEASIAIFLFLKINKRKDGETFWWGVILYSAYRFMIEFIRTNPKFFGGLTHAQWFSITAFFMGAFVLIFFRDPERHIKSSDDAILSPADGRIMEITSNKISIYLSLFDVHVNRSPVSGLVDSIKYTSGKYMPAFLKKASAVNENNLISIITNNGINIMVRQVAGIFARRIVCYCKKGDYLKQGDRIGMIRLGSCVQVYVPDNTTINVVNGDRVKAGETVIAHLSTDRKNT